MTKHFKRSIITDEDKLVEAIQSRFYKDSKHIIDEENEVVCHMVSERKAEISDNRPAHVGFCILAWSKLLFLRFVYLVKPESLVIMIIQVYGIHLPAFGRRIISTRLCGH